MKSYRRLSYSELIHYQEYWTRVYNSTEMDIEDRIEAKQNLVAIKETFSNKRIDDQREYIDSIIAPYI